jgi:hydrogenase/urease accessory protein HupE
MKPNPALRRNVGLLLVAAGVLGLLAGWVGLRDATFLADQVSYVVSGGIAGVALIMTGLALVASANAREEATGRLDRIEAAIQSRRGGNRP